MTFRDPGWLLLVVAPLALALAYVILQRRRSTYAVRFTNLELLDKVAPKRPGWRRHVTAAVFLVALLALVIAVARPQHEVKEPRERATVMMAIDTSLSMEATDVPPSRLEAAQVAANAFIDVLPPTINLGLVTFNGAAIVRVAPTTDREAVRVAVNGLELGEGTAIGEAIFASLGALEEAAASGNGGALGADGSDGEEPVPARIVLMSDGETTVGRPDGQAADAAVEAGVPVSTIAFGTPNGTITLAEPITTVVTVPVNELALQDVADATGGSFFTAASEDELTRVFDDIGSSVGFEKVAREITPWFVGAALMAFLTAAVLSLLWFARLP